MSQSQLYFDKFDCSMVEKKEKNIASCKTQVYSKNHG